MLLRRSLEVRLRRLAAYVPVVVVSGARQVGKSTLAGMAFPDWEQIVFDPITDVGNARAEPDLFLRNHPGPLILDEIQYAPELVPAIKRSVDLDRRAGRFLLTGSQQWGVMKALTESLAGRAMFLDLEGLRLAEIAGRGDVDPGWVGAWLDLSTGDGSTPSPGGAADAFLGLPWARVPLRASIPEVLWRGSMPEAWALPPDLVVDFHRSYERTYIERDARSLVGLQDPVVFGRFHRLLAALSAQEINHTELGRELGIARTTAQHWLSILAATFQWCELPAWQGSVIKRISARPKGHVADTGAACAALVLGSPHAVEAHPRQGSLFESAVVAEVRRQIAPLGSRPNLWHWRSHGGAEVDLVLERDGRLFPIEVKLTARPTARHATGIAAFRETYGPSLVGPGVVVCAVDRPMRLTERDLAVPWDLGVR